MEEFGVLLVFAAVAAFGHFMRKPLPPALEERDRDSVLFHLDKIKEQDFEYVITIGVRGLAAGRFLSRLLFGSSTCRVFGSSPPSSLKVKQDPRVLIVCDESTADHVMDKTIRDVRQWYGSGSKCYALRL